MKTYKLGNKVRCIVRSFSSGSIGSQEMMFNNQPYTILKDVEAKITFADKSKKSQLDKENLLYFNQEVISAVDFYNVEITDKILNLIYSKEKETKPVSESVNVELVNKKFILPISHNDIYQIFIYGEEGHLIAATSKLDSNKYITIDSRSFEYISNKNDLYDQNILVVYSYLLPTSYNLESEQEIYFTLDITIDGNNDDETRKSFIHIDKCALQSSKNLSFNNSINSIDLKFNVIQNNNNYISLDN